MFTLSGLFLEDGENLFRDFLGSFSISFLSFSARQNYLKKSQTNFGPYPARRPRAGPFISRRPHPPQPNSPATTQTLTLSPAAAAAPHAAAVNSGHPEPNHHHH